MTGKSFCLNYVESLQYLPELQNRERVLGLVKEIRKRFFARKEKVK